MNCVDDILKSINEKIPNLNHIIDSRLDPALLEEQIKAVIQGRIDTYIRDKINELLNEKIREIIDNEVVITPDLLAIVKLLIRKYIHSESFQYNVESAITSFFDSRFYDN